MRMLFEDGGLRRGLKGWSNRTMEDHEACPLLFLSDDFVD